MEFTAEHIEKYLSNQLHATEKSAFETELTKNKILKQELDLQIFATNLISFNEVSELKNQILNAKYTYEISVFKKRSLLCIASLLSIGVGIYIFTTFKQDGLSTTSIYDEIETKQELITFETKDTLYKKKLLVSQRENNRVQSPELSKNENNSILEESKTIISSPFAIHFLQNKIELSDSIIEKETSFTAENCTYPIEIYYELNAGCINKELSNLIVLGNNGAAKPFDYQLIRNDEIFEDFSQVADGNYILKLTDANSCKKEIPLTIKQNLCDLNFDFNPSLGQNWEELLALKNGKISIIHALSNELIFEKQLYENELIKWDGKKINNEVSKGFHIFVIQYENKLLVKGKITVSE